MSGHGRVRQMSFFSRLFPPKKYTGTRWKQDQARQICGHYIKYVTERVDNEDNVIGRSGALNINEGNLLVFASSDVLFRCPIESMQAWDLLSGNGVVITGPDLEHGGVERTIIVHYVLD